MALDVRIKRVYDPPDAGDGHRVLVDHVWPRGVSRERAKLDEWARELAPSDQLRKWFDHDPARFDEFAARYWWSGFWSAVETRAYPISTASKIQESQGNPS